MESMQCLGGNGYINGQCNADQASCDVLHILDRLSDGQNPKRFTIIRGRSWDPGDTANANRKGIQRRVQVINCRPLA